MTSPANPPPLDPPPIDPSTPATPVPRPVRSEFPEPVRPDDPAAVRAARRNRTRRLIFAGAVGVGVRLVVIVAEFAAYVACGAEVLLVDAVASLADVAASLALLAAVKYAERPPDDDHPFGHGRFEPLAGLQLGVLIVLLGAALGGRAAWDAVSEDVALILPLWAAAVPLAAAVLLEITGRVVKSVGRREHSSALVAEAYHYRIDAFTSLVAAIGLAAASTAPEWGGLIDRAGAAALASLMIALGLAAVWENLHQLVDRVPDDERFELVRDAAASVEGVLEVEKVRIQHAGPDAHVDIDVEVNPEETVCEAHRTAQHVRAAVQMAWPSVREVVVHVEPYYEGDH
ncbi:Ferrous-iron efflux pump FieF [Planctomycetes bacterium LzC2]|uniref:Ferrous-iron efflux pump FieF n=1 Tax=Alienimonas chondri TaxID=2681879 RepID=A0ABX1VFK5_9PLAN|nr:Ferrous-iron efflux pump FieF [Alienimonas chondri]